MGGFKDNYFMSPHRQLIGRRKSGGTRANDGHPFSSGLLYSGNLECAVGSFIIGGIALKIADAYWNIFASHDAYRLALLVLRTNPSTHGRKKISFADFFGCTCRISLLNESDKCWYVYPYRTSADTRWFLAVETAQCFA